ncbi:sensor histidine kinase [Clostridium formicaceticum]|uniref:histidine kinase n=1 Tax=Clostridium formicaceticum TaxID=1497 RepID=A0AAC9WFA6_9CLOT|nr:ATP-binding protein [Clostridium formicaceticum]AOY76121.1 hypothetical protein BJL90_09540 [Clostridium formicaceticum]ARE86489.1 Signal transduction histidine-protein kinase ArlS [Clostridium formicaceticum]
MNKLQRTLTIIKKIFSLIFQMIKLLFKGIGYGFKRIKKLFHFSITFKITVVYAFIFSLLLFFISASVLGISSYFLRQQANRELERRLENILQILENQGTFYEKDLQKIGEREDISIIVFDNKGKQTFSTGETIMLENMAFFSRPLVANGSVIVANEEYLIRMIKYLKTEDMYMKVLFITLFIMQGIAILITLVFGSKASRRMLKPIEKMTKTVKHISIHQLDTRLDVGDSQDELKDLAETFNEMLDRIEASYQQQNQFVSDASHELRTPISVLQGYANLLDRWGKEDKEVLQESIEAIKSESENMKDLIEKLLFLARTDKNLQALEKVEFQIKALILEVVKDAKLIDAKHAFQLDVKEDCVFFGDRKSIKQLLRILIDNSIKFTPEGGRIFIRQRRWKKFIVIEVEDTGIGIAKEDLPHIFERFYCGDKSRTRSHGGQGLGLSIAKWIVDSHDGKIQVKSSLGVGTKFVIMLPCAG